MEKKDKEKKKNKNISDVKNILVSNVNQLMSNPQGVANLQSILDKNILFQRKAMETKLLRDTFKFFDSIVNFVKECGGVKVIFKSHWIKGNSKAWLNLNSQFIAWMLMMVYQKQENEDKTWSLIFYEYMCEGNHKRRDILSTAKCVGYYELTNAFLPYLPQDMRLEAEEICDFFETHQIDPYSSVIGLAASRELITSCSKIGEEELNQMIERDLSEVLLDSVEKKLSYKKKYAKIISVLSEWSIQSTTSETIDDVKGLISLLRGIRKVNKGSVVIVKLKDQSTEKWVYGRVLGANQTSVLVNLDPNESNVTTVPFHNVLPMSNAIETKYFNLSKVDELEKCVELDGDILLLEFMSYCNTRIKKYLNEQSVNMSVIEFALSNSCKIRHMDILKKTLSTLNEIPPALLQEAKTKYKQLLKIHQERLNSLPLWGIFRPTKEFRDSQLQTFEAESGMRSEYRKYKGSVELAIEDLTLQRRELLSGNEKLRLSRWWLSHISTSVNSYLVDLGYQVDAVSDKYLDEPPNNILLVKKNLVLLRRILLSYHANTDIFRLKAMISTVCSTIYPVIISFVKDINYVLTDILNSNNLEEENIILLSKNIKDEKLRRSVIDLMKDKKYIERMQRIEEKKEKSNRDVIPISGLIISKLARLENECKSVLNLWEPTTYSKVEEEARTPIENAVIKSDIKTLDSLLKNGNHYINEQDGNGWTILHLSCSFCFNQTRLDVCKFLLDLEEMDYLISNNMGNIALHYLVRLPTKEVERPLFLQVIKMMLRNANTVFVANNKGETPLHSAILASNYTAVEEILKVNADPNFENSNGDTSLHYAVQSQNKEIVSLLLNYGAETEVKNKNGETPSDIAYKLNLTEIQEFLSKYDYTAELQAESQKRKLIRMKTSQFLIESKAKQALWQPTVEEDIRWTKPSIPDHLLAEIKSVLPDQNINNNSNNNNEQVKETSKPSVPSRPSKSQKTKAIDDNNFSKKGEETSKPTINSGLKSFSLDDNDLANIVNQKKSSGKFSTLKPIRSKNININVDTSDKNDKNDKNEKNEKNDNLKKMLMNDLEKSKQNKYQSLRSGKLGGNPATSSLSSILTSSNNNNNSNNTSNNSSNSSNYATFRGKTPKSKTKSKTKSNEIFRKALWNKTKDSQEELAFIAGEIITVILTDPSGWWIGKIGNNKGIFPANYTEDFDPDQQAEVPMGTSKLQSEQQAVKVLPSSPPNPSSLSPKVARVEKPKPNPRSSPLDHHTNNNNANNNNNNNNEGQTKKAPPPVPPARSSQTFSSADQSLPSSSQYIPPVPPPRSSISLQNNVVEQTPSPSPSQPPIPPSRTSQSFSSIDQLNRPPVADRPLPTPSQPSGETLTGYGGRPLHSLSPSQPPSSSDRSPRALPEPRKLPPQPTEQKEALTNNIFPAPRPLPCPVSVNTFADPLTTSISRPLPPPLGETLNNSGDRPLPTPPPLSTERPLPTPVQHEKAVLIADFVAETETELTLSKGSKVIVIKKEDGWCLVSFEGAKGYCPAAFLQSV